MEMKRRVKVRMASPEHCVFLAGLKIEICRIKDKYSQ